MPERPVAPRAPTFILTVTMCPLVRSLQCLGGLIAIQWYAYTYLGGDACAERPGQEIARRARGVPAKRLGSVARMSKRRTHEHEHRHKQGEQPGAACERPREPGRSMRS